MMDNQVFSGSRFVRCLRYFLRRDALVLIVGPVCIFCLAQFSLSSGVGLMARLTVLAAGVVYASLAFRELGGSAGAGVRLVMLPASCCEKTLALWLLSSVIFPGLLLAAALLAVDLRSVALGLLFRGELAMSGGMAGFLTSGGDMLSALVRFWALQAIFFWGGVFFRRKAFLKTVFALFIFHSVLQITLLTGFLLVCRITDFGQEIGTFPDYVSDLRGAWFWMRAADYFLPCLVAPGFVLLAYRHFRRAEV